MKLVVARGDLLKALDRVVRVAKPGPQAFMETLLVEAAEGALVLSCTDFDIEVAVSCPAVVASPGAGTVPADAFVKLVRRLPNEAEISLELLADPDRVLVRAKRSKVNLPSLPPSEHIRFGAHDATHRFEIRGSLLSAMLRDVSFASPEDESFGASVFGVCLHHDADLDRFVAVATNTRKLACRREATPDGAAGMPRIQMTPKAAEEIARLCGAAGEEQVTLAVSGRMIEVASATATIRSKLIEVGFAAYERILPRDLGAVLTVESEALRAALARAELVAAGAGKGVRLDLTRDALTVSVSGRDGAGIVDEIDGEFGSDSDRLSFSATLAQEILKAVDSDVVRIEVGRSVKHTIWRRPNGDGLFCLLAPMLG